MQSGGGRGLKFEPGGGGGGWAAWGKGDGEGDVEPGVAKEQERVHVGEAISADKENGVTAGLEIVGLLRLASPATSPPDV